MVDKYSVITLCGGTRFKEAFLEAQKRLTLEGNIVISVGLFGHSGDDEARTEGTKEMLDDMHKRKIDTADFIYVLAATLAPALVVKSNMQRRTERESNT